MKLEFHHTSQKFSKLWTDSWRFGQKQSSLRSISKVSYLLSALLTRLDTPKKI